MVCGWKHRWAIFSFPFTKGPNDERHAYLLREVACPSRHGEASLLTPSTITLPMPDEVSPRTSKYSSSRRKRLSRISNLGLLLFFPLYYCCSLLYPGGSVTFPQSTAFSWRHNYWCDLLTSPTLRGETNPAQPLAIITLTILCISVHLFFYLFSLRLSASPRWAKIIQFSGAISMFLAFLLFTSYHDIVVIASGLVGGITAVGILISLWHLRPRLCFFSALFCMLLLSINFAVYYSGIGMYYLPVIQKATLAVVLLWIVAINSFAKVES